MLKEIVDHKSDELALRIDDRYTDVQNGNLHPKTTTRGWKLLCEWKDGSTEWIALEDTKGSYPPAYAVANRIQAEPAFKWWVGDVLRTRNHIIGKVKSRYWRTTQKFGIRVPKSVPEALQIDKDTGTTCWWDAIKKEMDKVMVAFDVEEELTADDVRQGVARGDFVGYQEIACHWVFDVKMDLTRKARLVAGGDMTGLPSSLTYSSVVTWESVCIAFLIAGLNFLDVLACDIKNAYLNAPC